MTAEYDDSDLPETVGSRPIRDLLAALLRSRGYEHDDDRDPEDLYWRRRDRGIRPMLACIANEIDRDMPVGSTTPGWYRYEVSLATPMIQGWRERADRRAGRTS